MYGLDIHKPENTKSYQFLLADLTDSKSLSLHSEILNEIDLVIHLVSKIENTQKCSSKL